MGWGLLDMDVRLGLSGGSTSVSSSLERQLQRRGGGCLTGMGAVIGWGSQRMMRQESQQRGSLCPHSEKVLPSKLGEGKERPLLKGLTACRTLSPAA